MMIGFILFHLVIYLTVLHPASGCGTTQAGREKSINFILTDFKLSAVMVYSDQLADKSRVPTISTSKNEVETFIQRLIMQSVEDVLYQQGRSAFLSDSVISLILQQLDVQIIYDPLKCDNVVTMPFMNPNNNAIADKLNCIIIDGTVTSTCMHMTLAMCNTPAMIVNNLKAIDPKYFSISGSLKTSNSVMANWSDQMWRSVLSRVLRKIISSPNGSDFYGAFVKLT